MSTPNPQITRQLAFDPSSLPVAQLESLKFKVSQIMEAIQSLQVALEAGGHSVMPSWPEILTKYNVLLSQTHNLSTQLVSAVSAPATQGPQTTRLNGTSKGQTSTATSSTNVFSRLALHPALGLSDTQLDNDFTPLLRNQQTNDVLSLESETVRRLASRLLATLPPTTITPNPSTSTLTPKLLTDTSPQLLPLLTQLRTAHDSRCDRAVRAVGMLREKYDWKVRMAVETEEPEEFVPVSPLLQQAGLGGGLGRMSPPPGQALVLNVGAPKERMDVDRVDGEQEDDDSGDEEEELEEVLGPSLRPSPGGSPRNE